MQMKWVALASLCARSSTRPSLLDDNIPRALTESLEIRSTALSQLWSSILHTWHNDLVNTVPWLHRSISNFLYSCAHLTAYPRLINLHPIGNTSKQDSSGIAHHWSLGSADERSIRIFARPCLQRQPTRLWHEQIQLSPSLGRHSARPRSLDIWWQKHKFWRQTPSSL